MGIHFGMWLFISYKSLFQASCGPRPGAMPLKKALVVSASPFEGANTGSSCGRRLARHKCRLCSQWDASRGLSSEAIAPCCCRYTYTAEDVQKMIEEKRAKGASRRNVAAEKARLMTLRDHAEENNDYEALEQ